MHYHTTIWIVDIILPRFDALVLELEFLVAFAVAVAVAVLFLFNGFGFIAGIVPDVRPFLALYFIREDKCDIVLCVVIFSF